VVASGCSRSASFQSSPAHRSVEKPVFVEAFLTELAVEAFDIAVLHRAPGHDEVQHTLFS
jgi:hypothetical protein